jgi:hypothetical protein
VLPPPNQKALEIRLTLLKLASSSLNFTDTNGGQNSYLEPLRLLTNTLTGVAVVPVIPASVGVAVAVITTVPLVEGRQVQLATIFGDEPLVNLFLQPLITTFFTLKVTLAATLTFAEIVTGWRKVAAPLRVSELKEEVSTTSVTVIVIACVPALVAASVAVSVKS